MHFESWIMVIFPIKKMMRKVESLVMPSELTQISNLVKQENQEMIFKLV